jgi:glycosyltransferase involved in cell wall biosynthesis
MHILLIHQSFATLEEPGGTRHHELARGLVEHGHRVTVITSPISYLTGVAAGQANTATTNQAAASEPVSILRAKTYAALHRSFFHRVLAFFSFMVSSFFLGLRVRQVDLVWGTSPPLFQGVTAWLLARLKGAPFLFEVRDLWPAFAVAVGVLRQPLLIRGSEWLERFLYRRAEAVMVNSPGFQDHVQARGARRVELVPNGADAAMFDPFADGAAFRREHGLEGKFVALYAGAHGLSNDLDVVLRAAEHLRAQPEIAFVLLGDGKEKSNLMVRAAELQLKNVHFIASIPKLHMPAALAAADACIGILKPIPLYATVYPNKIFDYMAAGRPVVLAMAGVIRQVVVEAGAGLPVPPGDPVALAQAVMSLANDRAAAREMGLRGRRCIEERFDRPVIAARLAALVEQLSSTNKV